MNNENDGETSKKDLYADVMKSSANFLKSTADLYITLAAATKGIYPDFKMNNGIEEITIKYKDHKFIMECIESLQKKITEKGMFYGATLIVRKK